MRVGSPTTVSKEWWQPVDVPDPVERLDAIRPSGQGVGVLLDVFGGGRGPRPLRYALEVSSFGVRTSGPCKAICG